MSIWEHSRFKIFSPGQHPLAHSINEFTYANPRLPGISGLGDALDYVISVLYPNFIGNFANVASLPLTANKNDYAIVEDDGDGKAAGYIWSVIDNAGGWLKRYDMDWSVEGILADLVDRTMPMYAHKYGMDDKDGLGTALVGIEAGQHLYGGASENTHLTLHANSGDLSGRSGFVQLADDVRPTTDNDLLLGTASSRWKKLYTVEADVNGLSLSTGSILSGTGAITFGSADLTTTGKVNATELRGALVVAGSTSIGSGFISTTGGVLDFNAANLVNIGGISAASAVLDALAVDDLSFSGDTITSGTDEIQFAGAKLKGAESLALEGLLFSQNIISPVLATTIILAADIQASDATLQAVTSTALSTGSITMPELSLSGSTILSSSPITISGSEVRVTSNVTPTQSGVTLGSSLKPFERLFVTQGLQTATHVIPAAALNAIRNVAITPAQGDSLFWDSASSSWLASAPDTEVQHGMIAGVTTGDAGHTQFVMLVGRSGGQTIQGGTADGQSLTLESTSAATKGQIKVKDNVVPNTTAQFTTSWSGTDLGSSSLTFNDLYTSGEAKGLRLENLATAPGATPINKGRVFFDTEQSAVFVDTGTSIERVGQKTARVLFTMNGTATSNVVVFSTTFNLGSQFEVISATTGERIFGTILHDPTNLARVTFSTNVPVPAGNYYLSVSAV